MIDLAAIQGFEWDAGNARKNADKHDVSQAEAEQVFFNEPLLLLEDGKHALHEPRFHALGRTDDGRLLHISFSFTLRFTRRSKGQLIRVISARAMHHKERTYYAQKA